MTERAPGRHRHGVLLACVIVVWAISWPVIKIGVTTVPPIWFGCLRYAIAAACVFAFLGARKALVMPSPSDWRLVVVSGVLQMGVFSALTGLALTVLPPGRASVLAFSTPLWVLPLAAWRLDERVTTRGLLGVLTGLLGVLVIAAPALQRGGRGQALSYAMLLGASAAWAVSIVFVRGHRFDASPLALAPWQMLVASALLCPLAIVTEGLPRVPGARGIAALAYVGPIATGFAYWAMVEVGRQVPASTMAVALLATPSLGLLISAVALHEMVSASLISGIVLVGAGIRLATGSSAPPPSGRLAARDIERRGSAPLPPGRVPGRGARSLRR